MLDLTKCVTTLLAHILAHASKDIVISKRMTLKYAKISTNVWMDRPNATVRQYVRTQLADTLANVKKDIKKQRTANAKKSVCTSVARIPTVSTGDATAHRDTFTILLLENVSTPKLYLIQVSLSSSLQLSLQPLFLDISCLSTKKSFSFLLQVPTVTYTAFAKHFIVPSFSWFAKSLHRA